MGERWPYFDRLRGLFWGSKLPPLPPRSMFTLKIITIVISRATTINNDMIIHQFDLDKTQLQKIPSWVGDPLQYHNQGQWLISTPPITRKSQDFRHYCQ